jgi:glyoxylate reductase
MAETVAVFAQKTFPSVKKIVEEVARVEGLESLAEAEGLLTDGSLAIDDALFERAPKLRVVALSSVGYDKVDLEACARRGIPFSNARGTLTDAVADLSFALVLASMRKLTVALDWGRSGAWMRGPAPFGSDLAGKTLGIIGFGDIGAALARRARVSGMNVVYNNRKQRDDDATSGVTYRPFEELLATADCIVSLVPLTPQTRKMFGAAEFARMKPTTHFVNVGRGALVDTDALLEALLSGNLAGAALDVTDPEPLPPEHPLYDAPNLTIYPHIGSATAETRERMALLAARNLVAGLRGEPMPTLVNTEVVAPAAGTA